MYIEEDCLNNVTTTLDTVARLMVLAAETAPKAKGIDNLFTKIIHKDIIIKASEELVRISKQTGTPWLERDAISISNVRVAVLIGQKNLYLNLPDCACCGFQNCESNEKYGSQCAMNLVTYGIAIGSALSVASLHHVDNRVMYSLGIAARNLNLIDDNCTTIIGIPLSVGPKNPFFDRIMQTKN